MPTKHLLIRGKVQGVFYRASAKNFAQDLKITGWIKNTDDGYVEALVSGTESQLENFIDWCKQGPPDAIVTHVHVEEITGQLFEKFSIYK